MAAKRKAAKEEYKERKRQKTDPHPQAKKMNGSFTLGKRKREQDGGKKRKRKTRRRRRRRR